jgi:hypothetical protein
MHFIIRASEQETNLFELECEGKFVRFIKATDIDALMHDVSHWFEENGFTISFAVGETYELSTTSELESELTSLLVNGKGKKAIELPEELAYSPFKRRAVFSYRDVSSFSKYWKKNSYDTLFTLFEQLSQDLMEVPYVDEPHDQLSMKGEVAYHTTHGTTHGIRQHILSKHYLELIKQKGTGVFYEAANSLTVEDRACLELVAFLFRVGRTNELGWDGDPTYGPRSMAIFKQIALELKFSPQLIDLIIIGSNYYKDYSTRTDLSDQDRYKLMLFTKILRLSHESDLVRCFENYGQVKGPIVEELNHVIDEQHNTSAIADSYLNYAAKLCRLTGSKISSLSLLRTGDDYHKDLKGDIKLAISWVNSPKEKMYSLLPIRPSIFPELMPPTEIWFNAPNHSQQTLENKGWAAEEIEAMPTVACMEQETEHLTTHVSVYHATTKSSYALDLFCRELRGLLEKSNKTAWIRNFNGTPPGMAYKDLNELLVRQKQTQAIDNTENMSWHLLSTNPSLWQNSDVASEESTIDFFYDNNSVIKLKFTQLINELLDQEGVLLDKSEEREVICKQFLDLCEDSAFGSQGVIYQYLIPLHLVESTAYIAKQNGVYDEENPGALDALLRLKCPEQKLPNHNTLQVRLFVPNLLDERYTEQHIIVQNHLAMSDEKRITFEEGIRKLAKAAIELTPEIVKPEAKVKVQWAKYGISFFASTQVKLSEEENRARLQKTTGDSSIAKHTSRETGQAIVETEPTARIYLHIPDEPCLLFSDESAESFFSPS